MMKSVYNAISLFLIGLSPILFSCSQRTLPPSKPFSMIYEELSLPEEMSKEMRVRIFRARWGKKGNEPISHIDISFPKDDRHFRIDGWCAPIYRISAIDNNNLIFNDLPLEVKTIGKYYGVGPSGLPESTLDWRESVNELNSVATTKKPKTVNHFDSRN